MIFTREEIAAVCRELGPKLVGLPDGVDGTRLLWGIAGCESSFGSNAVPKFEDAYYSGRYSANIDQHRLNELYGRNGASSFGPWQVMLVNAPQGSTPQSFTSAHYGAVAAVAVLNRIMRTQKPKTLGDIGDAFNSGNSRDNNRVPEYRAKLERFYNTPMPQSAVRIEDV